MIKRLTKIVAGVFLLSTFFLLLPCFQADAVIISHSTNVTPVMQQKSKWCWAACAEMAGKNANPSSSKNQADAVVYVYGSEVNQGANISRMASAAKYVANDGSGSYQFYGSTVAWTFSQIVDSITNQKAVILGLAPTVTGTNAHAIVAYLTTFRDLSSGTEMLLDVVDPATGNRITDVNFEMLRLGREPRFNRLKYTNTAYRA